MVETAHVESTSTTLVLGLVKLPYETRLKRLNLWSLESRRVRAELNELLNLKYLSSQNAEHGLLHP